MIKSIYTNTETDALHRSCFLIITEQKSVCNISYLLIDFGEDFFLVIVRVWGYNVGGKFVWHDW